MSHQSIARLPNVTNTFSREWVFWGTLKSKNPIPWKEEPSHTFKSKRGMLVTADLKTLIAITWLNHMNIVSSESSSWFALVQNWWIQSESSFLVELLRIAIIVKSFAWITYLYCHTSKESEHSEFLSGSWRQGKFCMSAHTQRLSACPKATPEGRWWWNRRRTQKSQQLNQVKFRKVYKQWLPIR